MGKSPHLNDWTEQPCGARPSGSGLASRCFRRNYILRFSLGVRRQGCAAFLPVSREFPSRTYKRSCKQSRPRLDSVARGHLTRQDLLHVAIFRRGLPAVIPSPRPLLSIPCCLLLTQLATFPSSLAPWCTPGKVLGSILSRITNNISIGRRSRRSCRQEENPDHHGHRRHCQVIGRR